MMSFQQEMIILILPVNVSYKNQIKGIHHGHSSSGRTTYVEPEEIVSYNNQLSQLNKMNN